MSEVDSSKAHMLSIAADYVNALEVINNDYYNHADLKLVVQALIEEYLIREGGRLGTIVQGEYRR